MDINKTVRSGFNRAGKTGTMKKVPADPSSSEQFSLVTRGNVFEWLGNTSKNSGTANSLTHPYYCAILICYVRKQRLILVFPMWREEQ